MTRFGYLLIWGLLMGCSGPNDEFSPEEVKKDGRYCCFHDGAATTPECDVKTRPGGVWLADYSNVTPDGRGDTCGWILDH